MKLKVSLIVGCLVVLLGIVWFSWEHIQRGAQRPGQSHKVNEVSIEEFEALPYLDFVADESAPESKGVTAYNKDLSWPGVNLLTSRLAGASHLVDMYGKVQHSWRGNDSMGKEWIYAEADTNGILTILIRGVGLARMDWNSNVLWISRSSEDPFLCQGAYHHDFTIRETGEVMVLAHEVKYVDHPLPDTPICDDCIIVLSPDGVPRAKVSFYDVLGVTLSNDAIDKVMGKRKRFSWRKKKAGPPTDGFDIFHCNTVEEVRKDIGIAHKGDLLFCVRNLDMIGILDMESMEVIWRWGPGTLIRPHHPSVLENGNILVFDNGTRRRGYSRVLELNPATKKIEWEYQSHPPESFFSAQRGGCQRLPNGNTLITESDKGHVFEVTGQGDIVWDFWNPEVDEDDRRMVIYRMPRYDGSYRMQ